MPTWKKSVPTSKEEKVEEDKTKIYEIPPTTPIFERHEIKFGAILGSGAFCTVCAINDIIPNSNRSSTLHMNSTRYEKVNIKCQKSKEIREEKRKHLILQFEENRYQSPIQQGSSDPEHKPPPRYAIKYLKRGLNQADRERGIQDLEIELNLLLKCIDEPNIITLIGVGGDTMVDLNLNQQKPPSASSSSLLMSSAKSDRFLIMDRLRSTLKKRFNIWRERRGIGIFEALAINEKENRHMWLERMVILSKISSALHYLHKRNIIYRDLKPENVGFDFDDTPKLFDFGLARMLPAPIQGNDDSYNMTSMTGSPRYMAPEVTLSKPYGTKADVYSFAILMHEVLSLKVPFAGITGIRTLQNEIVNKGIRPIIDPLWPGNIKNLLNNMWDGDRNQRVHIKEVVKQVGDLLRGNDEDLFPSWGIKKWFK